MIHFQLQRIQKAIMPDHTFYSIELKRVGEDSTHQLGTARDHDDLMEWFNGAYRHGLLPNPPAYTDEIQIWEINPSERGKVMKWIWFLSWHEFEAKPKIEIVQ